MVRRYRCPLLLATWGVVWAIAAVGAHEFSQSESTIEASGDAVRVRFSLNLLEISGVDDSGDGRVSYDELDKKIESVFALIKQHYTLHAPDAPMRVVAERYDIVDEHVLQLDIRETFSGAVRELAVTSTLDAAIGPTHQHFAIVVNGSERRRAVLDRSNRTATFDLRRFTAGRIATVVLAAMGVGVLAFYRFRRR
jgi:hypothetical protein